MGFKITDLTYTHIRTKYTQILKNIQMLKCIF